MEKQYVLRKTCIQGDYFIFQLCAFSMTFWNSNLQIPCIFLYYFWQMFLILMLSISSTKLLQWLASTETTSLLNEVQYENKVT